MVKFSLKKIFFKRSRDPGHSISKWAIYKGIIEIEPRISEKNIYSGETDLPAQDHKLIRKQAATRIDSHSRHWDHRKANETDYIKRVIVMPKGINS